MQIVSIPMNFQLLTEQFECHLMAMEIFTVVYVVVVVVVCMCVLLLLLLFFSRL